MLYIPFREIIVRSRGGEGFSAGRTSGNLFGHGNPMNAVQHNGLIIGSGNPVKRQALLNRRCK